MRQVPSGRSLLFAFALLVFALPSFAQVRISVSFGPPALPVYDQPVCPGEGYIWTPGYWAWDADFDDYYWVPGTWVLAPQPGYLWTPPYWGWENSVYIFHSGYWGPHVGFYGGVRYGYGYNGDGYYGGRWDHDRFYYNRSVTNVNVVNVHNVYNENVTNVTNVTTVNRVSYSGGPGGVQARPTREQEIAERDRHLPPVAAQTQHHQEARSNPQLRASANQGRPPVAATERPNDFRGGVPAKEAGAPYHPPANRGGGQPRNENAGQPHNENAGQPHNENAAPRPRNENAPPMHARDLPPLQKPGMSGANQMGGNQKSQQQQQKLYNQQEKERQKLQQRQDKEDQKMQRQNADQARRQQTEQRHQQQTQQMQQRHQQQQEHMQPRQGPPPKQGPPQR